MNGNRPERGTIAHDRESDDAQVVVLKRHDATAAEKYVSAIDKTVAEANPGYPDDDTVLDIAFVEAVEAALDVEWEIEDLLKLHEEGQLDRARIKMYAYPESRLTRSGAGGVR